MVELRGNILNDLAILNVKTVILLENTIVIGRKLGYHRERTRGIDLEVKTIKVRIAGKVRVVTTAPLITDTFEATLVARALVYVSLVAGVRGQKCRSGVGFPDIKLIAA
jgi:hypothetical protein